tara:strand:- start:502 stop:705 length:204 start_codon:yes stop_codon:yes gene_type:complete
MKSIKYKNKDGIEINYNGNDPHKVLVREVIGEAIRIFNTYQMDSPQSMGWAIQRGTDFLKENFNLEK